MIEAMHTQQLYKTARLVLNVEEGMTDEDDVEHLEWLLEQIGIDRAGLALSLYGNWDPDNIDRYILDAA